MQLDAQLINDYTKIFFADENKKSLKDLKDFISNNRENLLEQLHQHGILLFRGFQLENAEQFNEIVANDLKLSPWNSFNPNMPGWFATLMRKYSENLLGAGDYRRYIGRNTVQLGPVENSIQGPHVEGGVRSERSRYIVLFCQEPSTYLAETGFNNLQNVWKNFPENIKQKYLGAWNHFSYKSARKVNFVDRVLLKKSPFEVTILPDETAKLTLQRCPLVIEHPNNKEKTIQPWAFAFNTNQFVHKAAQNCFENRGEIEIDSTANGMQLTWELFNKDGIQIEWNEEEKQDFFNAMYKDAILLQWHKGDLAIVDNVKIAHWRMNGEQGNRKLIQIQAESFNADHYAA